MLYLFIYTNAVYINIRGAQKLDDDELHTLNYILLFFVIYPLLYEGIQAFNGGVLDYLSDPVNYIDMTYIFGSIATSIVHLTQGPEVWYSRLLMSVVCLLAIRRTFYIMKIFKAFSPIITMMMEVFAGLLAFCTVFIVMLLLSSLNLGVIGWNDPEKNQIFMEAYAPEQFLEI